MPLVFSYFDYVAIFNELKRFSLHLLSSLIVILWSWQIVVRRLSPSSDSPPEFDWDLKVWAGRNPARWALLGAALWFFSILASTLLSPLPVISFFGGDEGRTGYNLYDISSVMVIFASVAFRFRTLRALEILVYTLVGTGTVAAAYGIGQHFGWDPIGGNEGRTRVIASFGNTLNFGGYMVMSIPATLAFVYKRADQKWIALALVAGALTLQITGIWFSGGRGPFVATAASIISFFVIAIAISSSKETLKAAGVLAASAVIASLIIALPSEQGDIGLERAISIGSQFASETESTNIEGGLSGRFNIWGSMLEQATEWKVPIEDPAANKILRPVFGVGPDMLVYVYPLIGQPQSDLKLVDHAHNYPIQILMEHGFLGLFGFLSMAALLGITVLVLVYRIRSTPDRINAETLIILAITPAMIGKMFELQTGVARISDLAMNFALFAATICIFEIVSRRTGHQESSALADGNQTTPKRQATTNSQTPALTLSSVLGASVVTVLVLSLFLSWDVRRLSASRTLATQWDHPDQTVRANAWDEAQRRSPERQALTFTLFESYLEVSKEQFALGSREEALRLLNLGRDMLLEFEKRDPLELDIQIGLSKAAGTLRDWGYSEFDREFEERTIKLAEGNPTYPSILGTSATALASLGRYELAIEYADRAIATEATTHPWSKAWYAKGVSLYELGRPEEAIEALLIATEKQPGAEGALLSHQSLANIFSSRGQTELAQMHEELGAGEITVFE